MTPELRRLDGVAFSSVVEEGKFFREGNRRRCWKALRIAAARWRCSSRCFEVADATPVSSAGSGLMSGPSDGRYSGFAGTYDMLSDELDAVVRRAIGDAAEEYLLPANSLFLSRRRVARCGRGRG